MATESLHKCAHPNCSCLTESEKKYCSMECESIQKTPDIDCKCPHPDCKGRASPHSVTD
jgi:hypothetical protein